MIAKRLITMIVEDEEALRWRKSSSRPIETGSMGDGKIFISDIGDAIRIRTGENGLAAI